MKRKPVTFRMPAAGCDTGINGSGGDNTFTLSVAVADGSGGMGSVAITSGSPKGNAGGAGVTVTAAAAANYHFVKWSDNIAGFGSVSTGNSYTFTINANTSICAVFAPDDGATGVINPEGTWNTDIEQGIVVGTFTGGKTWAFILFPYYNDNGTYTLEGNYGIIHSNTYNTDIGMFALTSATTITIYLAAPNPVTGIYHGTKVVP